MNGYEIFSTTACIILAISLIWIARYFMNKIEKLEDKIERLHMLNDMNEGTFERLEDDIYALMDRAKKEDTSMNSKAGYGHVFTLIKASTTSLDEQQVTVHTIDDLKTIWDKYGHYPDKCFEDNRLIINFDKNRITIYDDWVE